MSISRDLVALEETLRRSNVDPFVPQRTGSLLDNAELAAAVRRIDSAGINSADRIVRLCLQSLRIQYDEFQPRLIDAELVATLPIGVPGIARSTSQVLSEMLRPPAREVILLGYELTDEGMIRLLAQSARGGADVITICDRGRGATRRILDLWPADARVPRFYHDLPRPNAAPFASMHAKCLLVDGHDLLITSANFTFHGLSGNIEIGIRLSGPAAAEARKIFSYLVEAGVVAEV